MDMTANTALMGGEAMRQELAEQEPVAVVSETHLSRYTLEWTNGPLPPGTKLYTNPAPEAPALDRVTDKAVALALETRFHSDAMGNLSVRDYLCVLLSTLWLEGDSFDSKRPFRNSGWEYEIYRPLVAGGFIPGTLDQDGDIDYVDEKIANAYVRDLIITAFYGCALKEPEGTEMNTDKIDEALDKVLKASGSALRYYTMPKTLGEMRSAMRQIMSESYIKGTDDNFAALKESGKLK